jgi:hypothetical protein
MMSGNVSSAGQWSPNFDDASSAYMYAPNP